jgi:molybdenum cofactor cytidylyltransferase
MADYGLLGILLAGGMSRRFGSDKLLHPLPSGTPIAIASARNLKQSGLRCISLLRPEQQALGQLLQAEGVEVHYDKAAEQGMGRSLAATVRATPKAGGWLVALADMPFVAPATISLLASAVSGGARLAAPYFRQKRGHPVGFSHHWFESLTALCGDQGAREILAGNATEITQVPCDDDGILVDIDTQGVLDSLVSSTKDR